MQIIFSFDKCFVYIYLWGWGGFMTGLTRLANGNTIISFYQGSHHLIEVTPGKKLIWKWRIPSQRTVVSVQVLDEKGDASKGEVYK